MDIIQTFYDQLATRYDKLFLDWQATTHEQTATYHISARKYITFPSGKISPGLVESPFHKTLTGGFFTSLSPLS